MEGTTSLKFNVIELRKVQFQIALGIIIKLSVRFTRGLLRIYCIDIRAKGLVKYVS